MDKTEFDTWFDNIDSKVRANLPALQVVNDETGEDLTPAELQISIAKYQMDYTRQLAYNLAYRSFFEKDPQSEN